MSVSQILDRRKKMSHFKSGTLILPPLGYSPMEIVNLIYFEGYNTLAADTVSNKADADTVSKNNQKNLVIAVVHNSNNDNSANDNNTNNNNNPI